MSVCLSVQAAWGVTFRASIEDSRWDLEASRFNCRLSQPVPDYGRALFEQEAGEDVHFRLQPLGRSHAAGQALLVAEAPPWQPGIATRVIGPVAVDAASGEISVDPPYARQMLAYLHQGLVPTFTHERWQGTVEPLRVGVSAANFPSAYREYSGCVEGLLPVNFTQVARTALLFPSATTDLPDSARERLDLIALYVRNDTEVRSVYVDGHSDSLGRRLLNRDLSKKRAEAVTRYLVEQGIDESMITTRFHGERYPVVPNSTAANRDRNRRVTVRLERD
ncbi:flagellar protein MotY [Marinobacterium nitratireducens]|uniref:flagellar protein MotY n=1 Tax=Marinobacterium nitratireducens TaxID=518897 RepID=UPI001E46A439|nr:OmpA family protein [Marinobacterium nitratireducens]